MRSIHDTGRDHGHQRWAPHLRLVLGLACLAGMIGEPQRTFARDANTTPEYAHRLAVGVCGTCHEPHGNSQQPKFPRLAGQNGDYLAAQLKSFRSQTRGDPDAIGYMWGMAGQLDDATIGALASYYSAQRAEPGSGRRSELTVRGKEIYEQGIPAEGVPACASCHGPDAHGMGNFPRLAGQHAQYVLKQLGSFQTNMRDVAVMHGVAQNLRLTQMQAVAAYLESLP
jgi:cytochrome c553